MTTKGVQCVLSLASARFAETLTLSDLAAAAAMPRNSLTRAFNRRFGLSPMAWLWTFRTVLAAERIAAEPGAPLGEVARWCGFTSAAHFSRRFTALFRESPSRFRAHFAGRAAAAAAAQTGEAALISRALAKMAGRGAGLSRPSTQAPF